MQFWCYLIIVFLAAIILAMSAKIYLMRKTVREIGEAFEDRLKSDTNRKIGISSHDACMRRLADDINVQLGVLRAERHRFQRGDTEVKNAITNISHDIRTPLTSIAGYLELLEEEAVSDNAARYLGIIRNRTEILRAMVEELFDFSVDTSAELELRREAVDVNRLLQESLAAFYANFQEYQITPEIHMTEVRIIRQADAAALGRVFSNLLGNALKYSDGDLEVVLRDDGEILFANTAAGLSHVEVERLFDRFYTVENARRSRGLGLSIARLLMENMKGQITAEYRDQKLIIRLRLPEADEK